MENEETGAPTQLEAPYKNKKEVAKGGLLGFLIGLAIIVPGVSGSAIAIIFRLYERLLKAISTFTKKNSLLFLCPIVIGGVIGLIAGFFGVKALLGVLPFATVCLFAGLMLGAYPSVVNEARKDKPTYRRIGLAIFGALLPIAFSAIAIYCAPKDWLSLESIPVYAYFVFLLLGFLVALTQLVPGLSATALLMMVGVFTPLLNSISISFWKQAPMVLLVYLCLGIGFLLGLFVISKAMDKALSKWHGGVYYLISGLSLGSVITMFFNPEIMKTYAGIEFSTTMGIVDFSLGFVLFAVGLALAYLLVRIELRKQK